MAVNEEVYGAKENWYVPSLHTEQGSSISAEAYYYNDIATDETLKIKVANYNTLATPITTIRSQITGEYPSATFEIRNNWDVTQIENIDNSIVFFGIGSQSGLSNIDWYFVDWSGSGTQPANTDVPVLKNSDRYTVTNIGFCFKNLYGPYELFSWGYGSNLTPYANGYLTWTSLRANTWGEINSFFDKEYSSSYGYGSAYINTQIVTQLPIQNLKVSPVIYAYKNDFSEYKQFTSTTAYLTEKSDYPYLFCLKAIFNYRSGYHNDTNYDYKANFYPFYFNKTSAVKNYEYSFSSNQYTYDEVSYPLRLDHGTGITIAGRYGYNHGPNSSILGNEIYWTRHKESSAAFTIGEGAPILQTPVFHFDLDGNNGLFYCDTTSISDNDITEGIREQLASFGMFFVDDYANISLPLDNYYTFLGILTNGVAYGKYSRGEDNRNQPQWNWDDMSENTYDPDNPPTPPSPVLPDNWSNTTDSPYQIGAYPLPNHWYIATPYALTKMLNAINDVDLETLDKNLTFGLNPIDGVLQIKHVYCNRETAVTRTGAILTSSINIGELQLTLSLLESEIIHTTNINWIYTFESVTSYPVGEPTPYNDFRSYMPYSSAAFYDAFCGIVEIDPAKILNKYISIRQTVDFLSGDKITSLYASEDGSDLGERIAVLTGNCSHDLPINGLQTADYARNKHMLQKGIESTRWERVSRIAMGLAGASISAMTENVIGAAAQTIGTMANSKILETQEETQRYLLQHTVPSISKIQNGTSNVEAGIISGPTLFMYLPRMDENYGDGNNYKNLTGFSGYKVVKPSELSSGIHIFANPKISISGTKNEAIMLADQLKKGIIIK